MVGVAKASFWGECCGGGRGAELKEVREIPVWRSPHYTLTEKLINLLFHKILPVADMVGLDPEVDTERINNLRKKVVSIDATRYDKLMDGWRTETISFPLTDGTGEGTVVLHRPPGDESERLPLLYWAHGGGMTISSAKEGYGAGFMAELLNRGVRMVWASVEYRLAPEHTFPAAFDDTLAGLLYLLGSEDAQTRFGFDPARVHLAGTSAGANLTAAVANAIARGSIPGSVAAPVVSSVVVDQPMLDPAMNSDSYIENGDARIAPVPWLAWCWEQYLRGFPGGVKAARADWRVCPHLHAVAPPSDGRRLPPQIVVTTSGDALRDEGREYATAMKEAGSEVTHLEARGSHALGLRFDAVQRDAFIRTWADLLSPSQTA